MPKFCLLFLITLYITTLPINIAQAEKLSPSSPWSKSQYIAPTLPITPVAPITENEKEFETPQLSALEKIYAERLIDEPKQFGYDLFSGEPSTSSSPMGAVQDDFILASDDELQITFTGQRSDQDTYKVNSSGMIIIKDFPPIAATGRSIAQLRSSINAQLSSSYNTKVYVTLSSVRQIGVLVVGHVKSPGRKNLNVFHSVLDALILAGGIKKEGSLRQIKIVRAGRSTIIDLYALLMHGAANIDMNLKDGDRIIIPPIGPTLAISGAVKRPGIYEIRKTAFGINNHIIQNSEKLSLNAMLDFAGGILTPGQNRFIKLSLTPDGKEIITRVRDNFAKTFGDGSILSVVKGTAKRQGTIELIGHTRTPGIYDLSQNKTLASLLKNDTVLDDDIYPLIGVIERWNKEQLTTGFISFPVRLVLKGEFDLEMHDNDAVWLFSNKDISRLYSDNSTNSQTITKTEQGSQLSENVMANNPALKSFMKERSVYVRGAVRLAGLYPVANGTTLDNILAVAGGITLEANKENIEITSKNLGTGHQSHGKSGTQRTTIDINTQDPRYISISAGDAVRVNQKFRKMDEKTVLIIGEIRHPGEYDLLAGDKVSDLIKRAGGMNDQAYPAGAIFSRKSARTAEELRFRNSARNMQSSLAAAIERDKNPPNATQIEMVKELAYELSNIEAVGRITVETDPVILSVRKELDMLLEKGDRIYIPKRPLTVRVNGEILSPASLQFRKDKSPIDYINEAGGFTYHADKNRSFVLYPDGSAQPLQVNTWNHNPIFIPPGSTIIVPRDPKPFDFIESAKEIGQILSNLAITSVFINDIRD